MKNTLCGFLLTLIWVIVEHIDAKKYCWYFEEGYPIYFICRSYEDCCGTRCCIRTLSIQRLWYFWLLLMMGVLFCCGASVFLRRRMYPSPLSEEPAFNVFFTRQPAGPPGTQHYGDQGGVLSSPVTPSQHGQPAPPRTAPTYPAPPPSYCSHPPPPYEQLFQTSEKK